VPQDDALSGDECLRRLREVSDALREALGGAGWERRDPDGMNAKDYLAHVGRWQARLVRWWMAGLSGERRAGPEPGYTFEQDDALNERDMDADRDLPADEAWRRFDQSLDALLGLIAGLSDEDLNDEARAPWLGFPLRYVIANNTFGHIAEHLPAMRALARGALDLG